MEQKMAKFWLVKIIFSVISKCKATQKTGWSAQYFLPFIIWYVVHLISKREQLPKSWLVKIIQFKVVKKNLTYATDFFV